MDPKQLDRIERAMKQGVETQADFEQVLDALAELRLRKVFEYGEDRYKEPSEVVNVLMLYSDIYRKHIRLRKLSFDAINRNGVDRGPLYQLIELYSELATYAIMGVQICNRLAREAEGKG